MGVKRYSNLSLLPSEIIEWEILPRVPVKSVIKFKSVCKSWNLLISNNPDFIKSHLDLNPNNDSLILMGGQNKKWVHDNDSLLQCYTEIIGSINGLVCFYNWHDDYEGYEIAIWNPATKQCLTDIPNLPTRHQNRELERDDYFGFGFDPVANDFKVIYAIFIEEQPLVGEIYSCNHRCWRKITPSNFLFRGCVYMRPMPVTSSTGSPYWLIMQSNGKNSRLTVISFDVQNENFILLPEVGSIDRKQGQASVLMTFRDSIAVIIYDWTMFLTKSVDLYVLNERCSGWSKTSIGPVIGKEPTLPSWGQHLFQCFKNDDILFVSSGHQLNCVNLKTHAIKSLGKDRKLCRIVHGCAYSESLVFIKGMEHFNEKEDEVGIFFLRSLEAPAN
ncbi:F-box domain-containing protein [Heracleum sosnowskyi]|uniref:F-box domain-containing protein n=1 Tax=Heracleum sosnowskyi TaxID=360622 RepID=A0AAD8GUB7_9APIA|nr:F-box domain-containing protein [Heracleum sosnowskyi]